MEKSSTKSGVALIIIFFLLPLLVGVALSFINFRKAVVSKKWPTTIGTVVSSDVKRPSGKNTKYEAVVKYSYRVDTTEFLSDNLKMLAARGTSEWAKEKVSKFPVSSELRVFYNPKKPKDSVIEPGLQKDNFIYLFGSAFFSALVIFALTKMTRTSSKEQIT